LDQGNLLAGEALKNDQYSVSAVISLESSYLRSRRKRAIDLVFSAVGLAITAVMFPVIGLLIKLDSGGPVLYRQARLGIDGEVFRLVKFRTMVRDAESEKGAVWASKNDPRVTRIGRVLRRLYIDEFPQWWNVMRGQMSVVGPRPERPEMNSLITERYPDFPRRLLTKPGITGLAQTEYRYASSIEDSRHKLNYDKRYIQHASISLDAWVIIRTFRRMLFRQGT
jgi:lipopolysaccharide/colanic/teichoic acid biosynthesis glycosyltransferase